MKNAYLLTLALILISTVAISQNTVVEYRQKQKIDKSKISHYPEHIKKIVITKSKWASTLLIQKDNKSVYLLNNKVVDSIAKADSTEEKEIIAGNTKYFKDFKLNESLKEVNVYPDNVIIKDSLNTFSWKTDLDTKIINGTLCHKATTYDKKGRFIEAWYDKNSKIKNGPQNFQGLPGLIVKLHSEKWDIELVSINHPEKLDTIAPNKNAKIITPEDYRKNYVENPIRKATKY